MIKEVFELKKDSWHMKLMSLIWGFTYYDFSHFCNYFWLSVFNVCFGWYTVLPVKLIFRSVVAFFAYLENSANVYEQKCRDREEQKRLEIRQKMAEFAADPKKAEGTEFEDFFLTTWKKGYISPKKRLAKSIEKAIWDKSYLGDFDKLMKYFDEKYREAFDKIDKEKSEVQAQRYAKEYEQEEKAREARIKRKQQINSLVKKTKFIVSILAYAFGGFLGIVSFWFITKLYKFALWVNWKFVGRLLLLILVLTTIGLIIVGIIKVVQFLWCRYGKYCIPCEERKETLKTILVWILSIVIGILCAIIVFPFINLPLMAYNTYKYDNDNDKLVLGPISWLAYKIWLGMKQLWEVLVVLKQENCPGIDWK